MLRLKHVMLIGLNFLLIILFMSLPWSGFKLGPLLNHFPPLHYLILVYWITYAPQLIGLGTVWSFGLILDLWLGETYLGETALLMSTICYLAVLLRHRLRVFPLWQQSLIIVLLIGFKQLFSLLIQACLGRAQVVGLSYWMPSLLAGFFWPGVQVLFNFYRQLFIKTDLSPIA